jgi:hypothetical protein
MGRPLCLAAVLAAGLLAACGDEERPADSTRLTVEVTRAGPEPVRVELRCGGGQPCEQDRITRLRATLRKARQRDRACTLQYGGPERAHVTGTLEGRPIDVRLSRTNGCGIADYEALFAALGRTPPLAG